jgi:hypothetical protein
MFQFKRLSMSVPVLTATLLASTAVGGALEGLPENASAEVKRLAPLFAFDSDSCFPSAAISPDGTLNRGLKIGGGITGECRDPEQLEQANTYVRRAEFRVGSDVFTATMYALYFKKDQIAPLAGGHRHDWENVVLWQTNGRLTHVAFSAHGGYAVRAAGDLSFKNGRVAAVYHKEWYVTHCMRPAGAADVRSSRLFVTPKLVDVDSMDPKLRAALQNNDWGKAMWPFEPGYFMKLLQRAWPATYPRFDTVRPGGLLDGLAKWRREQAKAPRPRDGLRNPARRPSDRLRNSGGRPSDALRGSSGRP